MDLTSSIACSAGSESEGSPGRSGLRPGTGCDVSALKIVIWPLGAERANDNVLHSACRRLATRAQRSFCVPHRMFREFKMDANADKPQIATENYQLVSPHLTRNLLLKSFSNRYLPESYYSDTSISIRLLDYRYTFALTYYEKNLVIGFGPFSWCQFSRFRGHRAPGRNSHPAKG